MEYALGAVALAFLLYLILRRRDSRVVTIKALPKYGTAEAAELQDAITRQGPTRLVSPIGQTPTVVSIEPPRSEADFRNRIHGDGRTSSTPVVRLRRARVKPVRPKPLTAPRSRPGFAPPAQILLPASRCRICGRPLTNSESRRRGVGPDCLRNYGDRIVHVPNPAFAEWSNRKRLMEAQEAAWQALLDELFKHLMERFEIEMQNWSQAGRVAA